MEFNTLLRQRKIVIILFIKYSELYIFVLTKVANFVRTTPLLGVVGGLFSMGMNTLFECVKKM